MACQTCSHTMHAVGSGAFWCPRCGTIIRSNGETHVPKLPARVATLLPDLSREQKQRAWILGIYESVMNSNGVRKTAPDVWSHL